MQTTPTTQLDKVFQLKSNDLLSKFGFGDGDMFFDLLEEQLGWVQTSEHEGHLDFGNRACNGRHEVTCLVVQAYLMPLIPEAKIRRFRGMHNPARLGWVDGVEVDYEEYGWVRFLADVPGVDESELAGLSIIPDVAVEVTGHQVMELVHAVPVLSDAEYEIWHTLVNDWDSDISNEDAVVVARMTAV